MFPMDDFRSKMIYKYLFFPICETEEEDVILILDIRHCTVSNIEHNRTVLVHEDLIKILL